MEEIYYSPKYEDDIYEYRHVILPKAIARNIPKNKLLSEREWRTLGVQQSVGWEHYMIHKPELHILLFRRKLDFSKEDEARAMEKLMSDMNRKR